MLTVKEEVLNGIGPERGNGLGDMGSGRNAPEAHGGAVLGFHDGVVVKGVGVSAHVLEDVLALVGALLDKLLGPGVASRESTGTRTEQGRLGVGPGLALVFVFEAASRGRAPAPAAVVWLWESVSKLHWPQIRNLVTHTDGEQVVAGVEVLVQSAEADYKVCRRLAPAA